MPTTRIYPKRAHANLGRALPDMVRFLINDHPTITGPGWTIVEAGSGSIARNTASNPSDLDSIVGSASVWASGTINVNDWIVLESANGNNTNHFQLYLEYQSATQLYLLVIPNEDFVTGGAAASPPTWPTSSFGVTGSGPVTMTGFTTTAYYSIVADQGMAMFLFDDFTNTNVQWTYVGEIDGARSNGNPPDDRAYVAYDTPSTVRWVSSATTPWNRASPVDDVTILSGTNNGGETTHMVSPSGGNGMIHELSHRDFLLGVDSILPIGIYYANLHRHFAGFLRNVYSVHYLMGSAGTLDSRRFAYRNNAAGAAHPGICFRWDGSSAYP